jgi:hypothetical protein
MSVIPNRDAVFTARLEGAPTAAQYRNARHHRFLYQFKTGSAAHHVLKICRAEACQSMGCDTLIRHVEARLEVRLGVGISADVDVSLGKKLDVLIEKDFRCLDPLVAEDQSDAFENPLEARVVC